MLTRSLLALSLVTTLAACSHSSNSSNSPVANSANPQETVNQQVSSNASLEERLSQKFEQIMINCDLHIEDSSESSKSYTVALSVPLLHPADGNIGSSTPGYGVQTDKTELNVNLDQPVVLVQNGLLIVQLNGSIKARLLNISENRSIDGQILLLDPSIGIIPSQKEEISITDNSYGVITSLSAALVCIPEFIKKDQAVPADQE